MPRTKKNLHRKKHTISFRNRKKNQSGGWRLSDFNPNTYRTHREGDGKEVLLSDERLDTIALDIILSSNKSVASSSNAKSHRYYVYRTGNNSMSGESPIILYNQYKYKKNIIICKFVADSFFYLTHANNANELKYSIAIIYHLGSNASKCNIEKKKKRGWIHVTEYTEKAGNKNTFCISIQNPPNKLLTAYWNEDKGPGSPRSRSTSQSHVAHNSMKELTTSTIGKYRVGDYVHELGEDGTISGKIIEITSNTPGAISGPGKIKIDTSEMETPYSHPKAAKKQKGKTHKSATKKKSDSRWPNWRWSNRKTRKQKKTKKVSIPPPVSSPAAQSVSAKRGLFSKYNPWSDENKKIRKDFKEKAKRLNKEKLMPGAYGFGDAWADRGFQRFDYGPKQRGKWEGDNDMERLDGPQDDRRYFDINPNWGDNIARNRQQEFHENRKKTTKLKTSNIGKYYIGQFIRGVGERPTSGKIVSIKPNTSGATAGAGVIELQTISDVL